MIRFKNIKIQNFLSIGDEPVNLSLDTHNITSISGDNGAAKSAICIDSIYYALYGKSFRNVNLNRLINSTNKKNMYVELDFHANGNDYKIIRGKKPDRFEIYINGKLKEQSSTTKEYQNYLLNHILKIDEKTYKQIVVLGSTAYTSFMALPAADRRVVIEQLLNLNIFEYFVEVTKKKIKEIEDDKRTFEKKLSELKIKISMHNKNKDTNIENYNNQILEIERKIVSLENDKKKMLEKIEEISNAFDKKTYESIIADKNKKQSTINEANELKGKLLSSRNTVIKNLKFLMGNNVCPTCNQSLESDFIKGKISALTEEKNNYDTRLEMFEDKIQQMQTSIREFQEKLEVYEEKIRNVNELTHKAKTCDSNISIYKNQIEQCRKFIEKEKNSNIENVAELENEITEISNELGILQNKFEILDFFISEFKDGGVKTRIIASYIDVINRFVQKYLRIEGFEINFTFDEYFNESIGAMRMENFEFNNLSEGERKRVDIAVLFAFRDLSQLKSCVSTNLLCMDEYDSGVIDDEGQSAMFNILKSCKNQNIFIISHSTSDYEQLADRNLVAKKIDGFSYISEK